jgi:hypothetical protein
VKRRRIIAAIGTTATVGIAGCGSDSDQDDGNSDQNGGTTIIQIDQDTRTLEEDAWYKWGFVLDQESQLELDATVRSGPAIDLIMTSQSEFEEFEQGNRFEYNQSLSLLDTVGGNASGTLPQGQWALIADNTEAGEAQPPTNLDDDIAEVEVTLISET